LLEAELSVSEVIATVTCPAQCCSILIIVQTSIAIVQLAGIVIVEAAALVIVITFHSSAATIQ
jgi:hypothetical protein